MSVCFVVVPVVIGSWPLIAASITAAGAALGYRALSEAESYADGTAFSVAEPVTRSVQLVMDDSQVIADTLMRGESFSMERDGIQADFKIDGRGACQVHLSGRGMTDAQLEAAGLELMDRVRQQFAYSKMMQELEEQGFEVVHQEVEENQSIRVRVRRM